MKTILAALLAMGFSGMALSIGAETAVQPGQSSTPAIDKTPEKSKPQRGVDVAPPNSGTAKSTAKKKKSTPPQSNAEKRLEQHRKDLSKNWGP